MLYSSIINYLDSINEEQKLNILLLGKTISSGILNATLQISAITLFVSYLGADWLGISFLISGIVSLLVSVLVKKLNSTIPNNQLEIASTLIIFVVLLLLRLSFLWHEPELYSKSSLDIHSFIFFIFFGPLIIILSSGERYNYGWQSINQISNSLKNILSLAKPIAAAGSLLIIYVLIKLSIDLDIEIIITLSSIASFILLITTSIINSNYNYNKNSSSKYGKEKEKIYLFKLLTDKYVRFLALFISISVAITVFVEFNFLAAIEIKYNNEKESLLFLSLFLSLIIVVGFISKEYLSDLIITKLGIKSILFVMPLFLMLITLGAIVFGLLLGNEVDTDEYLFYFVLVLAGKIFISVFKESFESQAYATYFLPVNVIVNSKVQEAIRPLFSGLAMVAVSTFLITISLLTKIKMLSYSYFILTSTMLILYLLTSLYARYKTSLDKSFERIKDEFVKLKKLKNQNTHEFFENALIGTSSISLINALNILEKIDPLKLETELLNFLGHFNKVIRIAAFNKVCELNYWIFLTEIENSLNKEQDNDVVEVGRHAVQTLKKNRASAINFDHFKTIARSINYDDRLKAAKLFDSFPEEYYVPFLIELLRDINPQVRIEAIKSAGKIGSPDLFSLLIENLHIAAFSNSSASALVLIGERGLRAVDSAFYKTDQYLDTMIRVVQVIGRIGGKKAMELLWRKIDYPHRKIQNELLESLYINQFQAKSHQYSRIKTFILNLINDISWNINASKKIASKNEIDQLIKHGLKEENEINFDRFFKYLSILYDPKSIDIVKENINKGIEENTRFGLEILETYLDDELKTKVIPLIQKFLEDKQNLEYSINNSSTNIDDHRNTLLHIINRDFNRINRYNKALAIIRYTELSNNAPFDIIANLFNSDPLLRQTAAYAIFKIDQTLYEINTKRINASIKKELDRVIVYPSLNGKGNNGSYKLLLIDRIRLIKNLKYFKELPGEIVSYFAESMDEISFSSNEIIINKGDSNKMPVYIINEGIIQLIYNDEHKETIQKGSVFGYNEINTTTPIGFSAVCLTDCNLLAVNQEILFDLLTKYKDLLRCWLKLLGDINPQKENESISGVFF